MIETLFPDVTHHQPSIITIGVFDGVHRGHQTLLSRLVRQAQSQQYQSIVITFFPHPDVVIKNITTPYYLCPLEERESRIRALGVDFVYTLAFNDSLRQVRASAFVEMLVERLQMRSLWVGADFALGYKREGNVEFLRKAGETRNFSLHTVELLMADSAHHAISSTAIRAALAHGDVETARDLLGRAYQVRGEVVHGQARGRTIGFPTANIQVWREQVIPQNGVYAGWAFLGEERFMAVTNVGNRPTFDGQGVTVEAHLLDFDRDIYGQSLTFTFEKRLRPEMKFNGIESLIAQIRADADSGRAALSEKQTG
jgi:riboflavin kinase / FMN adenylyltransferase